MNNLIRFNVGSIDNIQASTWRVWQEKDEVYILAREMKKWLKVSLHKSGQCHIKLQTDIEKNTEGDYYLHRWYLPDLSKTRPIIETFRITIPANCIENPLNKNSTLKNDAKEVTWIESNKPERISVLFITANKNIDESFMTRIYPNYSCLKIFSLENRNIYILFIKELAQIKFIQEVFKYTEKLNINYSIKPEEDEKYVVMLEFYKNKNGAPEILNTIPGENSIRY
jgi:hypothetical protein